MSLPPLIERELRVAARRSGTYGTRLAVAGVFLGFAAVGMLAVSGTGPGSSGQPLFRLLAWLAWFSCLVEGVRHTADCLSSEKREGTLGLLFLTDLTSREVVLGKLAPAALQTTYGLLAVFPVLGLALVTGGVTAGEVTRVALVLLATLGLSLATGLMISARSEHAGPSLAGALGVMALTGWLPGTALGLVFAGTGLANLLAYGVFLLLTVGLSLAALERAVRVLPRSWQTPTLPATPLPPAPALRATPATPVTRAPWSRRQRSVEDQVCLEQTPLLWLALRGGHRSPLRWLLLTLPLGGTALVGATLGGPFILGAFALVLGALALGLVLVLAWAACQSLAEFRRSGLLELLITTPLVPEAIPEASRQALWERFSVPVGMVLLTQTLLALACMAVLHDRTDFYTAIGGMGLVDCWLAGQCFALTRMGMYFGLRFGHTPRAFGVTLFLALVAPGLLIPAVVFVGPLFWLMLAAFPYGLGLVFEQRLRRDFARLAGEPPGGRHCR